MTNSPCTITRWLAFSLLQQSKNLEDKQPGLTSEVTGVKHFIISLSLPVVHQSNVISLAFFAEYFLLNVLLNN